MQCRGGLERFLLSGARACLFCCGGGGPVFAGEGLFPLHFGTKKKDMMNDVKKRGAERTTPNKKLHNEDKQIYRNKHIFRSEEIKLHKELNNEVINKEPNKTRKYKKC